MSKTNKYGLKVLTSEEDCQIVVEQAYYNITDGNFRKNEAATFLDQIYASLDSKQTSSLAKTMTMHIIKEINYKFDSKLMSILSSHILFDFLSKQANRIDTKKRLEEKGSTKFADSPQLGIQYMRVLLECINFWGQKYARGNGDQPSKFKKLVSSLKSKSIDLPKQYIYLDVAKARSKKKNAQQAPNKNEQQMVQKVQKQPQKQPSMSNMQATPSGISKNNHLAGDLAFTKDKISLYMATLEDEDDDDTLRNQIHTNHSKFSQEFKKYNENMSNMGNIENQNTVSLFFKIHHFLDQQSSYYAAYVEKGDYSSYLSKMKELYENAEFQNKQDQKANRMIEQKNAYYTASQKIEPRVPTQPNLPSQHSQQNLVSNIFSKFESRAKSPIQGGFRSINRELEKEKEAIRKNPLRRTSRSPLTNRSVSLSRSATGIGSKISAIFNNPPNRKPAPKVYEGTTVQQNQQLSKTLFAIKKQQGSRRFKISNFRQKNPLFENQHIQVGYKSSAVYENISGFNEFICLNLFIGNKTDSVIKNCKVQYKADTNQLLYANPKNVDSLIPTGYQNKQDLMICPLKIPFSFMVMNISYSVNNSNIITSVVLPNSMLKFASYMNISKRQFQSNWAQSEQLKTLPFQLCKHFAPDSLKKWIAPLQFGTDYKRFSEEGSQIDFQSFCQVILLQKYQGVLKINVRPNLKVVLQVGVLDNDSQAREYFTAYLQTLELIMKQIDV